MQKELNVQKEILLKIAQFSRMFRNNVGVGWVGKSSPTKDKGLYIQDPRPLKAGLGTGSSDLIGWTTKIVTPEMVGKKIAIFTAIEVKKTTKSKASQQQLNFIKQVKLNGGIAGVAHTPETAVDLVSK